MIRVILCDDTGKKRATVELPWRKGDAGTRILRALQSADEMKKGGWTIHDLTNLDAGLLTFHKAASLYSDAEVKAALEHRLDQLDNEGDEVVALRTLLESDGWRSTGISKSIPWRETVTLTSPRMSKATKPQTRDEKMRKSLPGIGNAHSVASSHAWERAQGDQKSTLYQRGLNPGHEIEILNEGDGWEMRKGAKVLASSKRGASNAACAASLHATLTDFDESK